MNQLIGRGLMFGLLSAAPIVDRAMWPGSCGGPGEVVLLGRGGAADRARRTARSVPKRRIPRSARGPIRVTASSIRSCTYRSSLPRPAKLTD
jgi:hypothetical protein